MSKTLHICGAFFLVFLRKLWYSKRKVLTPKYCIAVKDQYMSYSTFPWGKCILTLRLSEDAAFFASFGRIFMETRVAVISIIIEKSESVQTMNEILHQYSEYIIGRMGIPYRSKGINIISIAVDAPQDKISALSGKIGKLPGVTAKAAYSNVMGK